MIKGKAGDTINDYQLTCDLKAVGQCKWGFAVKDGREYFIKEFLSPVYPAPDSPGSEKTKEKSRAKCVVFEKRNKALIEALNGKCVSGGNLVVAVDFFLFPGTHRYYKVTEKIDVSTMKINDIAHLPLDKRLLILKTIAHSLRILHNANIVHGDLKPDNILIKKTDAGVYTTKLIDFDSSYFTYDLPLSAEIVGDPVYYSPELGEYIENDDGKSAALGLSSDIFALGIIYYQYLMGKLPVYDREKYLYIAVLNGFSPTFDKTLPEFLKDLLQKMLRKNPKERPDINEVFECLKKEKKVSGGKIPITPEKVPSVNFGCLGKKEDEKTDVGAPISKVIIRMGKPKK